MTVSYEVLVDTRAAARRSGGGGANASADGGDGEHGGDDDDAMLLLDDGGRNASGGGAAAAAAYEAAIRAQLERALVARGYFGRATKVLWVDFSTYSPAVHSVTWTRLAFEARQFQKR